MAGSIDYIIPYNFDFVNTVIQKNIFKKNQKYIDKLAEMMYNDLYKMKIITTFLYKGCTISSVM